MNKLILLLLTSICGVGLQAQKTKKVLFIGNSYTAYNQMVTMIDSLAIADGNTMVYDVHAPGGQTLKSHTENPVTFTKIKAQKWDYVVLQEQSQIPSFEWNSFQKDCVPYAKTLVDTIRANNACTIPVFFTTWGRRDGDPQWDSINTFHKMNDRLDIAYNYLAKVNGAHKIAVGFSFATVKEPGGGAVSFTELYDNDGSHPSRYGTYLASCMFYSHLFETKSQYNSYQAGYRSFYTDYLQTTADYAYKADEKNRDFFPKAEFSSEMNTGSLTVAFTDHTYGGNADFWLFGDGDSSKLQNPAHTYPRYDLFGISLYTSNSCGFKDTLIRGIRLVDNNQNSITDFSKSTIHVFPNPSVHVINVAKTNAILYVSDMLGRVVLRPELEERSLDISDLRIGTYVLHSKAGNTTFIKQ